MACGGSDTVPETEEEKALAEIAMERWQDYKQRFVPVEDMAIQDVLKESDTPSDFGPAMANLGTQAEFSRLEPGLVAGLQNRGSSAVAGGIIGLNRDRAASTGLGQANALGLQRTQNLQNLQQLVNMGQGQAGGALSGLADTASLAQQQAIMDARASAAARAAVGGAIGTGAGMWYGSQTGGSVNYPGETMNAQGTTGSPVSTGRADLITGRG